MLLSPFNIGAKYQMLPDRCQTTEIAIAPPLKLFFGLSCFELSK